MKKLVALFSLLSIVAVQPLAMGVETQYVSEDEVVAPKWEDYVPKKYQNPRSDFTRKSGTTEMIWGAVLTDTIILCPVGIPMICHGSTKRKHVAYREKKEQFMDGLEQAKTIENPQERQEFYNNLIKDCKLKRQD